ncbi:HNH endonuclease family protein [[Clostridium] bifermentans ATCC 638]|uniref:HNH endonuclease family protein n=1 Tax=Paraclostridium bifermentans ATCC 638 = DSM 14991 TaxID=1233171 RepID=T4VGB6_PARBF|nr:HNH endonuclease signature motif containing protein [Paraclostridium bifermentans]EQK42759.1 HNH endonuclease family protein [[Clostridium] bifermentans ATCC 638] [Paraclostridium bifermentans ATCC 638 = DSM 14991]RIZ58438.1 HNH endonuclease [Paraclostridium bifermentans]UAG19557.1 HNH endonuclease [Paraclostridium bifermentans]
MKTIILDGMKFTATGGKKYHYNSGIRKHLHQYIWEKTNGPIPKGHEIHHIDLDANNNDISNLQLLTIAEHKKIHKELSWNEERREWARNNLIENARPKASEWHGSDEGKEWHRKHYEKYKDKIQQKQKYICECCGNEFEAIKKPNNRFCSNNCKSKWRRNSGIDNVERECEYCKNIFIVNKYSKAKTCSLSCANKKKWEKRKLKDSPNLQE